MTDDELAEYDALQVGDKVYNVVELPGEPVRHVPAKVFHKRYHRDTGKLCSIDLRLPHGLMKEVPLFVIELPSAVERLGKLGRTRQEATMGLSTADCRNFLATNPTVQKLVADRSGLTDANAGLESHADVLTDWVKWGATPGKWKRQNKYKVGSKTDTDGGPAGGGRDYGGADSRQWVQQTYGVDPAGGVVREFWLEGTDHITLALLEKDAALTVIDDLSD